MSSNDKTNVTTKCVYTTLQIVKGLNWCERVLLSLARRRLIKFQFSDDVDWMHFISCIHSLVWPAQKRIYYYEKCTQRTPKALSCKIRGIDAEHAEFLNRVHHQLLPKYEKTNIFELAKVIEMKLRVFALCFHPKWPSVSRSSSFENVDFFEEFYQKIFIFPMTRCTLISNWNVCMVRISWKIASDIFRKVVWYKITV